jgi:serine O-acetyltransferase
MTELDNAEKGVQEDKAHGCKDEFQTRANYKEQLPEIIDAIVDSCKEEDSILHLDIVPIPSREAIIDIIGVLEDILYPGFFGNQNISTEELTYHIGEEVLEVFKLLSDEIKKAHMHECYVHKKECFNCSELAQQETIRFLEKVPKLRGLLNGDVRSHFANDPASKSYYEVVFCYPGVKAMTCYRIAHELFVQKVPLIPRIITEYAHTLTGIDIHPGATIGERFFIDHGTGVVIGETTEIGDDVCIYHGVTMGALHFDRQENGELLRGKKRHPTIGNRVIIYSGSTLLGEKTVVGDDAIIGGNSWVLKSVPSNTKVVYNCPELTYTECDIADTCEKEDCPAKRFE